MDLPAVRVLSICAGAGGLDLGIRLALQSSRSVCFVEHEAFAARLLVARMEDGTLDPAPVWTDLRAFDGHPWRGAVDLLAGGIPCQPHSVAGRHKGRDDPRNLWPDTLRIAKECEAPFVFIENVGGIVNTILREMLADLASAGYRVEDRDGMPSAGLFSAEEVGAPHQRKRLFVLVGKEEALRQGARLPLRREL